MADSKISALPASTTPLAGTEVLPIVQSSATKQVSVANLTAGRAVSALSLTITNDSTINDLTTGKGAGAIVSNTSFGYQALSANVTGLGTTSVGYQAGKASLGNYNTFVGFSAGLTKTGNFNTAVGASTLQLTDGGMQCTAVGYGAAYPCTADRVTAIGNQALGANTSGGYNTAVGYIAGQSLTTGSFNCYFGYSTINSGVAVTGEIVVGQSITGKGSNTAFIGGSSGAYNGANAATWSVTSDQRIKKNIADNNIGLDIINKIQVRNFEYRLPEEVDSDLVVTDAVIKDGVQLGVIAQELQKVLPNCVKQESTGVLTINTNDLTWYLINAVKELSARLAALETK